MNGFEDASTDGKLEVIVNGLLPRLLENIEFSVVPGGVLQRDTRVRGFTDSCLSEAREDVQQVSIFETQYLPRRIGGLTIGPKSKSVINVQVYGDDGTNTDIFLDPLLGMHAHRESGDGSRGRGPMNDDEKTLLVDLFWRKGQ